MIGRIFRRSQAAALVAALAVGSSSAPAPAAPAPATPAPAAPAPATPAPATPLSSAPAAPPALSYADAMAAKPKPAPASPPPSRRPRRHHRRARASDGPTHSVLRDAETHSTEIPRPQEFVNAMLHYTWEPGKLYTVQTAVGYLTAIALRPGEHLLSKAAGDTVKWEVGETAQGTAAGAQVLLLIKPLDAGQRTNMILTTDQRTYVLDLVSAAEGSDHATFVDWRYPADDLRDLELRRAALTVQALAAQARRLPVSPFITPAGAQASTSTPRLAGPAPSVRAAPLEAAPAALNFEYRIVPEGRRRPAWTPEHVFDDGHKTYVKFPATISTMQIPPLFVIGPGGEAELVNYRFQTGYYIVDRLFSSAELRIGTKDPQVVRITYKGGPR